MVVSRSRDIIIEQIFKMVAVVWQYRSRDIKIEQIFKNGSRSMVVSQQRYQN